MKAVFWKIFSEFILENVWSIIDLCISAIFLLNLVLHTCNTKNIKASKKIDIFLYCELQNLFCYQTQSKSLKSNSMLSTGSFQFYFLSVQTVLQAHQIVVVKIDIVLLIFDRKQDQHLFWYEIGSTLKSWKCLKTNLFLNDVAKSIINKNMFFVSGTVHNVVICYIVVNNVSRMQFCQTK